MERELGISESKHKSEQVYDAIMTMLNRKIDKIRQKALLNASQPAQISVDDGEEESAAASKQGSAKAHLSQQD